jgi:hypothetical protein
MRCVKGSRGYEEEEKPIRNSFLAPLPEHRGPGPETAREFLPWAARKTRAPAAATLVHEYRTKGENERWLTAGEPEHREKREVRLVLRASE